jgi:hypothetical protein
MRSCAERAVVTSEASSVSASTETTAGPVDNAAQAARSVIHIGMAAVD